jgi:hypothetical protein
MPSASDERMPRRAPFRIVEDMSTTTRTTTTAAVRGERPDRIERTGSGIRMRLSTRTRKLVLLVHIAAAGAWLGLDLVLGILVVTALTSPDATGAGAAAASIATFATWPLVVVGLVTLLTGVLLGFATKYGLVRYWWVLVKLVINAVLVVLVMLVLSPGVTALGEASRAALEEGAAPSVTGTLLFPPIVSSTAVVIAMTLAVFKPWGRVQRSR